MSKTKRRKRFSKGSSEKALRRWRRREAKKLDATIAKILPLLCRTRHDSVRSFQRHDDLQLWRLPNRRLNPRDRQVYKRYVDSRGTLRYEPRHVVYDLPLPVVIGAWHIHPLQLRNWHRNLKKLQRQLDKKSCLSSSSSPLN